MGPGFEREERDGRILWLNREALDETAAEALRAEAVWTGTSSGTAQSFAAGRGATRRVDLGGGRRAVVKKMRRGGLAGRLWRDRFPGSARLAANLTVPLEAASIGIPTARPLALLLQQGPTGLYQAWLATEEIPGAVDLLARLGTSPAPDEADLACVLQTVRRAHDDGLDHPDLNLGNLLVAAGSGEPPWTVWIIDLDRARLTGSALSFAARQRCLRRLERSYVKNFSAPGPLGPGSADLWYELYAGDDGTMRERLRAGRGVGRLLLGLHRAAWNATGRASR